MSDTPLAPPDGGDNLAVLEFDRAMAEHFDAAPDLVPDMAPAPPLGGAAEVDGEGGEVLGEMPELSAEELALLRLCAAEEANDIGNGARLRHRHGENLINVQRIGWFVWDKLRWQEDIEGAAIRPVTHSVVKWIMVEPFVLEPTWAEAEMIAAAVKASEKLVDLEAAEEKTQADQAQIAALKRVVKEGELAEKRVAARRGSRRRFATASGNSGKIDGMLKEAAPYLSHAVGEMDADPLALNLENGTLRFGLEEVQDLDCPDPDVVRMIKRGVAGIRPHDRADLISKLAPVAWNREARADVFLAFIEKILPNKKIRDFLQRYFGYCLTALTREQVFVILHGEGRNGKSTLVDIICRVLGDYATSVPIATLVGEDRRKGSEATPDLVRLPAARLVRTAEPKEGMAFDESLIKQLTSGEPILVRRLNQEFVEIYPKFKLVVSCNRKPLIRGDDDGIWRRTKLVPFDVQIPEEEIDMELPAKLWDEREGVLGWLIEGAMDYLSYGLAPPEEVQSATREYRAESDILGEFVRGALQVTRDSAHVIEAGTLYGIYQRWCERTSHTPWKPETFNRRMPKIAERMGFTKGKASISTYAGIRPRPDFEPQATPSRTHYG